MRMGLTSRYKIYKLIVWALFISAYIVFCTLWIHTFLIGAGRTENGLTPEQIEFIRFRGSVRSISESVMYLVFLFDSWYSWFHCKNMRSFAAGMGKYILLLGIMSIIAYFICKLLLLQNHMPPVGYMNFFAPAFMLLELAVMNAVLAVIFFRKKKN